MSYRDDLGAARARTDALERELAEARAEIAALKGESKALVRVASTAITRSDDPPGAFRRIFGGPKQIVYRCTLDGELPDTGYAELIEVIRDTLSVAGTVSTLPGSLTWRTGAHDVVLDPITFYATSRGGKTELQLEEKLGQTAGLFFGMGSGIVGTAGSIAAVAALASVPVLAAVAAPLWFGVSYAGCRKAFAVRARDRDDKLETLMAKLAEIAARYIAEGQSESEQSD